MSPIEKVWKAPSMAIKDRVFWDKNMLVATTREGWAGLSMETINSWIDMMPDVMEAVIESEGRMTGH